MPAPPGTSPDTPSPLSAPAILAGIHACLSADPMIRERLGTPPRLFDRVPSRGQGQGQGQGTDLHPFLTYGEMRCEDAGGDDVEAVAATLNLHVYTRYAGRAEAMEVISAVLFALARQRLRAHIPGLESVTSLFSDSFPARNSLARHSVLRLRLVVADVAALQAAREVA